MSKKIIIRKYNNGRYYYKGYLTCRHVFEFILKNREFDVLDWDGKSIKEDFLWDVVKSLGKIYGKNPMDILVLWKGDKDAKKG